MQNFSFRGILGYKKFYIFVYVKMKKLTVSSVAVLSVFLIGALARQKSHISPEEVVLYDIMEEEQSENVSNEESIDETENFVNEEGDAINEKVEEAEIEEANGSFEEEEVKEEITEDIPMEDAVENAKPIDESSLQTMASVANYYIIYSNDPAYPQGCNTVGLNDPFNNCILAIPNGTGYVYVSPGATDKPFNSANGYNYCMNLNIGSVAREIPSTSWQDPSYRNLMYANKTKITTFTAPNSPKANHYRTLNSPTSDQNCIVSAGNCGSESSSTVMSIRCVTLQKPKFHFTIEYTPTQPTTGSVTATVTLTDTGTLTFADPTGRSTIDNVIFTKTYTDNLTGESVTFQNASGDTRTDSINVTWIMPETSITYSPSGPNLTTGNVTATIGFNKP
ncbi:hypothetical protein FACS189428_1670 [Clostridia bacterium]|nr:hypothetical protein FACS189428_1670 [Clostridia bacterium]